MKRHRSIKTTYDNAINGKPLEPGSGPLKRAAHYLGQRALSQITAEDEALKNEQFNRFNDALENSKGINKLALGILATAAKIPHQASTNPLAGTKMNYGDETKHSWNNHLSFGPDQDPSRAHKTPLLPQVQPLILDSPKWLHEPLRIPIDNLSIMVSTTTPEDNTKNTINTNTTMIFNTREYDPESLDLDNLDTFTGGVKIEIDSDGLIAGVEMTKSGSTGYSEEDPNLITTNLSEFLGSVLTAAESTARAYENIPDLIDWE